MRATLEQLKAMGSDELQAMWDRGEFPFDYASCGFCLTLHGNDYCTKHPQFTAQVRPVWERLPSYGKLHVVLEELYALRLFYDSLYPQETPAPQTEQAVAESEANAEVCEKEVLKP